MTAVKFPFGYGVVQGQWVHIEQGANRVADHGAVVPVPRRRGDRQRQAIVQAVRELLEEKPFAQLSVSTISDRAGVARSGFYFYFDSKYAVLAQILADSGARRLLASPNSAGVLAQVLDRMPASVRPELSPVTAGRPRPRGQGGARRTGAGWPGSRRASPATPTPA